MCPPLLVAGAFMFCPFTLLSCVHLLCIPKVCEHNMLSTSWRNFTKIITAVHLGPNMNRTDFEIKR